MKKLARNTRNRTFAGVLGGLAEYFDIDPVALRVIFIFFVLITGFFPGVLAYLIAILIIPPDTMMARDVHDKKEHSEESKEQEYTKSEEHTNA